MCPFLDAMDLFKDSQATLVQSPYNTDPIDPTIRVGQEKKLNNWKHRTLHASALKDGIIEE